MTNVVFPYQPLQPLDTANEIQFLVDLRDLDLLLGVIFGRKRKNPALNILPLLRVVFRLAAKLNLKMSFDHVLGNRVRRTAEGFRNLRDTKKVTMHYLCN